MRRQEIKRLGGATHLAEDGAVGTPSIGFREDRDTGFYRPSANNLSAATQGAQAWNIDADGLRILPLQSAFLAFNTVGDADVTGDGTNYTVDFDSEVFDRNADFASDTFTAPIDGIYCFFFHIAINQITTSHTTCHASFVTSNRTFTGYMGSPGAMQDGSDQMGFNYSILADMDASDTCTVRLRIQNDTKTVDTIGSGSAPDTSFGGFLVA